jgi:hypothetical protein
MADVKPKVAVVVVHGVAYHAPGASARAASELLHGLRLADKKSPYGPDTQETVSIPLKQLKVKPLPEPDPGWMSGVPILGRLVAAFQERTVFLTRAWKKMPRLDEPASEKVANDFMRLLLQDYRGVDCPLKEPAEHDEAASYVTTRIKMMRGETPPSGKGGTGSTSNTAAAEPPDDPSGPASRPAQPEKEVHIYECYWADLSRPKNTILSFFQGLYQMLFHVGSLSRLAISTGSDATENRDRKAWKRLDRAQHWAVRILTLPIPILNVILFISLFGALPHLAGETTAKYAAVISGALLGLLVCMIVSPRLSASRSPMRWVGIPVAFGVVFGGVAWLVLILKLSAIWILALEGWILGAGIVYLSVSSYDEVRDGAKEAAALLYGLSFVIFLGLIWRVDKASELPVAQASLWMVQIVLAGLRASWILLFISMFLALCLGSYAWRFHPKNSAERGRAKAAVRTSRFALAMPTLGILIVTLALWSGLFVKTTNKSTCQACPSESLATSLTEKTPDKLGGLSVKTTTKSACQLCPSKSLATRLFSETTPEESIGRWWIDWSLMYPQRVRPFAALPGETADPSPDAYFRGLLVWSATPAFPMVLVVLLMGIFLLLLWLVPSILTEKSPPRGSNNASSKRMGGWLSRGLDTTAIVFVLFGIAAFVSPLGYAATHYLAISDAKDNPDVIKYVIYPTALILQWLGLATGSLAILVSVAKSGSSVLGIILDVDNYLRTSPKEKTPRARIVERYVSLLRYLADEKNGGYERIVILAHSLGALISGDLLLYLKTEGDPDLSGFGLGTKIPIRLFTMGDPARQFLNRFFPYLYKWVRDTPDNGLTHLGKLTPTRPNTRIEGTPNPNGLGLERWVNAYRSGDYIGRSLWLNEWYGRTTTGTGEYPQPISVAQDNAAAPVREEMCIGAGAHQHYWDQSAPDIAEKLDLLISL